MISIICVYNKKDVLDLYLLNSLKKQKYKDYEIILVDNSNGKYKCASDALNYGASNAKGDYLMFIHQDVEFCNDGVLDSIVKYINKIKKFGIIGVAGTLKNDIITNIIHGRDKIYAGNVQIDNYMKCECLDEVLFIIKKDIYDKFNFSKNNKTWHLYCVEYCLEIRKNNLEVYVIPCDIYHASSGASFDNTYYKQIKVLASKYKKNFDIIRTTCGIWYTNKIKLSYQINIRKLKGEVKKWLKIKNKKF